MMTNATELAALRSRLEISGADRTRWPAQERLRFAPLITQNDEARRLVAEAAALDRLLDAVPQVDAKRLGGLIDRIVAAAEAEGGPATAAAGNVVSIDAARRTAPAPRLQRPIHQRSNWQAAALLAASLFVGAFVGTSGLLGSAVPGLTGGEYDVADLDATELLLDGNRSSLLEEDTL